MTDASPTDDVPEPFTFVGIVVWAVVEVAASF